MRIKQIRKIVLLMVFLLFFCGGAPGTADVSAAEVKKTGLEESNGKYYYYQKGKKVKNAWKEVKSGKKVYRYYFGGDGAAFAGKVKYGQEVPAVKKIGIAEYAFDSKGRMLTGIRVIKKEFYVFSSGGKLNSSRTASLRKASRYESDAGKLKRLLKKYGEKPKKTEYYGYSCFGDGEDGMIVYANFEISIFRERDGKPVVIGLYPR